MSNPFIAAKEAAVARVVAGHLRPGRMRVLEVGCGEGSNLFFLAPLLPLAHLVGLDFSPEKVSFLAASLPEVAAVCADATALPFKRDTFDLVLCRDLLHHVDFARDEVLAEALRVVKKEGVVIVIESDGTKALNRLFRLFFPAERGLRNSSPQRLLALGSRHGKVELIPLEASFLIRSLAFLLGWPAARLPRLAVSFCYASAGLWERLVAALVSKNRWTYLMLTVRKG